MSLSEAQKALIKIATVNITLYRNQWHDARMRYGTTSEAAAMYYGYYMGALRMKEQLGIYLDLVNRSVPISVQVDGSVKGKPLGRGEQNDAQTALAGLL